MEPHAGQPIEVAGAPLGEAPAVMIMVHGRNAAPKNILDLAPRLQRPDFTYLAPAAANKTWYPYSFMADVATNEPGLSSALHVLDRLVADVVAHGIGRDRIMLLGFSQGACLTAEYVVRHPARYGGVILYSGGLVGAPGTTWNENGSFAATPIFLGCSDVDAHVPRTRVEETAVVYQRMGADVALRIYPAMGHLVNDDEIAAARAMMDTATNLT